MNKTPQIIRDHFRRIRDAARLEWFAIGFLLGYFGGMWLLT